MHAANRFRRALRNEDLEKRQLMAANVAAIKLDTLNVDGEVIDHVEVGQMFILRATAQDLRPTGRGVFAAYTDVAFNGDLVSTVGEIKHSSQLANGRQGSIEANEIEEAGGFAVNIVPSNSPFQSVGIWQVQMKAEQAGKVVFATNPADDRGHEFLLFDDNNVIDPEQIDFGSTELLIGDGVSDSDDNPTDPPFSIDDDSDNTSDDESTSETPATPSQSPYVAELRVSFSNEAGEKIDRVQRGSTFFANVSVYMFGDQRQYPQIGLDIQLASATSEMEARGASTTTPEFDRSLLRLITNAAGKLAIESYDVVTTAQISSKAVQIQAPGFSSYNFSTYGSKGPRVGNIDIAKLPMTVQSPGPFSLNASKLVIAGLPNDVTRVVVEPLDVYEGEFQRNALNPMDVDNNGSVTPIDALLGITQLRRRALNTTASQSSAGETTANSKYFYDSNGDGNFTPVDVLLVIGKVRQRTMQVPEGESTPTNPANVDAVFQTVFAAPIEDSLYPTEQSRAQKKARFK